MTLFEISASLASSFADGRSMNGVWGNEKQFYQTREEAEVACQRLRNGGYWGSPTPPAYQVEEITRERFSDDDMGEHEWRHACKQAGVNPVTGEALHAHADLF